MVDDGYQITGMAHRATVTDNHTNDYGRIAEVAEMFLRPEAEVGAEYPLIRELREAREGRLLLYVVCGHASKYRFCDMSKLPWMAQIARERNPEIDPRAYYFASNGVPYLQTQGLVQMGEAGTAGGPEITLSPALQASLLFRLSYTGYSPGATLTHFELCYQSQNQIVRIFRLKKERAEKVGEAEETKSNTVTGAYAAVQLSAAQAE